MKEDIFMKKIINDPQNLVDETLARFIHGSTPRPFHVSRFRPGNRQTEQRRRRVAIPETFQPYEVFPHKQVHRIEPEQTRQEQQPKTRRNLYPSPHEQRGVRASFRGTTSQIHH